MPYWQADKYYTLMALQNVVLKNSLWRSIAIINPKTKSYNTTLNKDKGPVAIPHFKRLSSSHNLPSNHGNSGIFGGNGSKGAFASKGVWGRLIEDVKAESKSFEYASFDKFV